MTDFGQPSRSTDAQNAEPEALPPRGSQLRPVVILGLAVLGAALAVVTVLQIFGPRRIPDLTDEKLLAAEALWNRAGPADYDMDIEIRGNQPGIVHVEVRGGDVTAMQRDGIEPKQRRTWDYWSVPGRFDELDRELEMAADPVREMQAAAGTQIRVRCEFDPKFGYPRRFQRVVYGGGTEVYWQTTSFSPK